MRKLFSIIALTVFMAGNLNAMPVKEKSCEDRAWHAAEKFYDKTGDSILSGQLLELALSLCEL